MSEGKFFHIHAPATGKVRHPTVESLTARTNRLSVVEDRSLYREEMFSDNDRWNLYEYLLNYTEFVDHCEQ